VAAPSLSLHPFEEDIMSLTLYFHPLSSFCQKVLIGLYELDVPFTKRVIDLGAEADRAALLRLWPIGKFPVLHDEARGLALPESSIILEYVDRRGPEPRLVPKDLDRALECRLRDRFFDLHVDLPMQKVVTDKFRPADGHDPFGVAQARAQLETAYGVANEWLRTGTWAAGDTFTMADCAAAPALFFANKVLPFEGRWTHLARYYARLLDRPSVVRTFDEAKPHLMKFPG
jgi:glutathione S-transferase